MKRFPTGKPVTRLSARLTRLPAKIGRTMLACLIAASFALPAHAEPAAKQVFGRITVPDSLNPASYGFYSKGCMSGAVAMPVDGPTWQTMRLSRNRRWGHPNLIAMIEDLSIKANKSGWNGLLVGDISQPRGGPMLTGHASHQIGLDADIWLTPMPNRRMTYREREDTSAISVLKNGTVYVDDRRWNKTFEKLLYHAASHPQVERLLVHPGIKKKLCETVKGDRTWLRKVRPTYGHHYHFHIRMACQPGSAGCKRQNAPPASTGCDETLAWWFDVALAPKKPSKPSTPPAKPSKPKVVTLSSLPDQCREVVNAQGKPVEKAVYKAASLSGFVAPQLDLPKQVDPLAVLSSKPIEASRTGGANISALTNSAPVASPTTGFSGIRGPIPVPTPRPLNQQ